MQELKNIVLDKLSNLGLKSLVSEIIFKGDKLTLVIELESIHLKSLSEIKSGIFDSLKDIISSEKINIVTTNKLQNSKSKIYLDNVKNIVLVSSGKGGVGKSTIAAALAMQLCANGYKVGILDADIHGPSIPTIFGVEDQKIIISNDKFVPIEKEDICISSVGLMINDANSALAWRGPMVTKLLYKMLSLTAWPKLDYLIIDMPPGTGDIHLSLIENYHISGSIIITTPQKLAVKDVMKLIDLYKKLGVKIYGIVENMSNLPGDCGRYLSNKHDLDLIAQIPLSDKISEFCDKGENFVNLLPLLFTNIIR